MRKTKLFRKWEFGEKPLLVSIGAPCRLRKRVGSLKSDRTIFLLLNQTL